jgi:serine protease
MRKLKGLRPFFLLFAIALSAPVLQAQTFKVESFQGREVVSGEILVRFRDGLSVQGITSQDGSITSAEVIARSGIMRLHANNRDVASLLQAYQNRFDVLYAEPNYVWHKFDLPNDARFGQQWALRNTGQTIESNVGVSGADIHATQAWDISEGSRGVVVGVIDTGVDYTHPDLIDNVWSAPAAFTVTINGQAINCPAGSHGFDAISRTCDPMDTDGHGTHVAGIIAANGNNGTGVSGVNRIGSIMALRFLTNAGGTTSDAIAAIDFAIQVKTLFPTTANIRILNASWGGTYASQFLRDELTLTQAAEMLVVASAGNDGVTNDLIAQYPANYDLPNLLAVAATDNNDRLANFSNWGTTTVNLGAPGVDVLSTLPSGAYGYESGTSMAAPMVSGAAALVLSSCTLSTAGLRSNILSNVDAATTLTGRTTSGGRLNVYRAVSGCAGPTPSSFRITVTPGTQSMDVNGTANLTVSITAVGGFTGPVSLSASALPAGFGATFSPSTVGGTGTAIVTLTTGPNVASGTYAIRITGTSGSQTFTSTIAVTIGVAAGLRQTINGSLSLSDQASPHENGHYSDFYRLTLASATDVVIDLKSRVFDTTLYVLSPTGATLLTSNDDGDDGNSRISTTLSAGTYTLEATSKNVGIFGDYSLSINTPTLNSLSQSVAAPGTTANVTLTGTRFASGMTIDAGSGVTVSNISITSATSATATLTIAANATASARSLTVTTTEGTSNPVTFWIPPAITAGQRISGSLSASDASPITETHHFADLFRLTLAASTAITIDGRSDDFESSIRVLSSTGALLYSDHLGAGDGHARISRTLAAGTYFIEATSTLREKRGDYQLSINLPILSSISPVFAAVNGFNSIVATGAQLTYPMTTDAGTGISTTTIGTATSATISLTVSSSATVGLRTLTVTTSAGTSNGKTFTLYPQIPDLAFGQTLTGTLAATDVRSPEHPDSYQDLFRVIGTSTDSVLSLSLRATTFNASLFLYDVHGVLVAASETPDASGNLVIRGGIGLSVYYVGVTSTSASLGSYTLSWTRPTLELLSTNFGVAGTTVDMRLLASPLMGASTVNAGTGISVSGIVNNTSLYFPPFTGGNPNLLNVVGASLAVAANAVPGPRSITFSNSAGTSNPVTFTVFPSATPISLGQRITGTLSPTDVLSPVTTGAYADLYRVSLPGTATPQGNPPTVTIHLESSDFDGYLYVTPVALTRYTYTENHIDDESGGNHNARYSERLGDSSYYILVTSAHSGLGNYTLTAEGPPTLQAISPSSIPRGSSVGVTLTGTGFLSPMVGVGDTGITVSNVTPLSQTSAIATITVGSNATLGSHTLFVGSNYGDSGTITFNVVGPQPSQLNFPKLFSSSALSGTGFAIMNPTSSNASVDFTLYSASGSVVSTSNQTVPARGQLSKLGSELFPGASQDGWIRATSSAVGLQSFWAGGNFTTYMDAAAAAPASQTIVFPLVTPQSEINVANAGTGSNTVTFRVYGASGTELATAVTQNIATNGIYSVNAATLFPSVNFTTNTATIRATGTLNVTGTSVTTDYPIAPSWAILNGVDTSLSLFEVDFPHVPSGPTNGGPAWQTVLGLTNISTSSQTVTITFTHNSGATTQVTRTIAGSGTIRETIHSLFGFASAYQEGWIRVTGTSAINGFIVYGYTGTGGAAAVPAQGTAQTKLIFSHVANGPGWGTGLALLNATTTDATVQVYVMNPSGTLVGGAANVPTATFTLPAGTKVSKLINELVPTAVSNGGFVYIRTSNNVPIYGTELFFTSDVQVLANVASGILDPSIDYQPPTQ